MSSDQGKKPDMVAVKPDRSCIILDVQVVNGSMSMEQTRRAKIRKYDRDDLRQAVSELKGVEPQNIRVMAVTLLWRGVWCGKSATELRKLGISVGQRTGVSVQLYQDCGTEYQLVTVPCSDKNSAITGPVPQTDEISWNGSGLGRDFSD
ncbi:hypothetical protein GE061_005692 [Apolygus lucorum]|uniref:Uncharacterized protein n=1 Tax=Apolygus lucorum TaxID=248454 RepID=A0A8S9X0Y8_APOLU|nr:hypothetical protein GE061_005692 [Apolygus lucorum]